MNLLRSSAPRLKHLVIKEVASPSFDILQLFDDDDNDNNNLQHLESLAINEFGCPSRDRISLTYPTGLQVCFLIGPSMECCSLIGPFTKC